MKNLVYVVSFIVLMYSCANPVAPSGGEVDINPPIAKIIQPASGITNYQGDRIEFIFDEYIVYSSGLDKLLITPPMSEKPKVFVKGKKLIIKLPENLADNTTYNISLLGAISDYNAGNTLNILKHVFSTGDYIDSASISGLVKNAYNNKNLEKITIGLYPVEDTSILIKSKPLYLVQSDASGNFKIENVKEGYYKLAAIEDKNLNFLFDQTNERISLPSNPIFVTNNTVLEQNLKLFNNESKALVEDYKLLGNNSLYFTFNKEIESISLDVEPYFINDVVRLSNFNDTLFYHWSVDSLKAAKFYFNLNNESLDTIDVNYSKNKRDSILKIESKQIALSQPIVIKNSLLIAGIDTNQIEIRDTSSNLIDYTFEIKENRLLLYSNFKALNSYSIKVNKGAIDYLNGSQNKNELFTEFGVNELEIFKSNLILSFNTEIKSQSILELLNSKEQKIKQFDITNQSKLTIKDLKEGVYYIRIYADLNNNAKWTTGSLEKNYEAEPCLFYSPKIEMKANWDKDFSINF